jgi:hypothetical protein
MKRKDEGRKTEDGRSGPVPGPRSPIFSPSYRTLLFVLAVLLSASCGRRGDLRPPGAIAPKAIQDFRGEVSKDAITLSWSRPTERVDGSRLGNLSAFVIYRRGRGLDPACIPCTSEYREVARLNVEDQGMIRRARTYRLVQRGLTPETVYRYKVFSLSVDGTRSEASNEAEVEWEVKRR